MRTGEDPERLGAEVVALPPAVALDREPLVGPAGLVPKVCLVGKETPRRQQRCDDAEPVAAGPDRVDGDPGQEHGEIEPVGPYASRGRGGETRPPPLPSG